jgi:hypothetical protein
LSVGKDGRIIDGGSYIQGSLMEKKTAADQGVSKIESSKRQGGPFDESVITSNVPGIDTFQNSVILAENS